MEFKCLLFLHSLPLLFPPSPASSVFSENSVQGTSLAPPDFNSSYLLTGFLSTAILRHELTHIYLFTLNLQLSTWNIGGTKNYQLESNKYTCLRKTWLQIPKSKSQWRLFFSPKCMPKAPNQSAPTTDKWERVILQAAARSKAPRMPKASCSCACTHSSWKELGALWQGAANKIRSRCCTEGKPRDDVGNPRHKWHPRQGPAEI